MNNDYTQSVPVYPYHTGFLELLEKVSIPAALGDDRPGSNVAPKNGAHKNKIVVYEANGHTYIYDSNGIPVPMSAGVGRGGVFKTTAVLPQAVGADTVIDIASINAPIAEIVIGQTIVWDEKGTIAIVTGFKGEEVTVSTMNSMPGERAGTIIGTVDYYSEIPLTRDAVKELGFQDPIVGDTVVVRTDETHEDQLTKYMIFDIDGRGNITWKFDHILNDGDYQLKSEGAWSSKILTAGSGDGEFGEPIDPMTFVHDVEINNKIVEKDENGVVKFTSVSGIKVGDEEIALDEDGIVTLPKFVKSVSVGEEDIPQDESGNIALPKFVKSVSVDGEPIEQDEAGNVDITMPSADAHYIIRMNYDNIEAIPETEIFLAESSVAEVIKNTEIITLQDFFASVQPNKDIIVIHGTKDQTATNECTAHFVNSDGTDMTFYVISDTKGGGGGEGGSSVLTEPITVSNPIGRYTQGKRIDVGTPLEDILRNILEKVSYPTLTNPSVSLSYKGPVLKEIGEVVSGQTATLTFDRGKINPAYGTSGFRAGEANKYTFFNNNVENVTTTTTYQIPDMSADTTLQAKVDYDAGEQPKDSDNKNYNTPLAAGSVSSSKVTVEFVYAVWSNAVANDTIAKMPLYNKSTQYVTLDFANAVPEHPETVDIPSTWTVSAVEVYDTVSKSWQATTDFDTTTTQHDDAAGRPVDYTRYFDKRGFTQGARQVRLKVKVN